MANVDELQLKVTLQSQVKAPLMELKKEIQGLADSLKQTNTQSKATSASMGNLAKGVLVAEVSFQSLQAVLGFVKQEFTDSVAAANKYQSAMLGLSSVAAAFGQSQREARDAAKSLSDDGLLSVNESATGLKNLLASGFSLPEAINLMNGFKDSAAFGRQAALTFGEAVTSATEGIKNGNSILVDNAGITKNLSVILEEAGKSQNDLLRVQSDASVRTALYNGLLREMAIFQGDSAKMSETLQGAQSELNQTMFNLHKTIGQALTPALIMLTNSQRDVAKGLDDQLRDSLVEVQKALAKAAFVVQVFVLAIKTGATAVVRLGESVYYATDALNQFNLMSIAMNKGINFDNVQKSFSNAKDSFMGLGDNIGDFTDQWDKMGLQLGDTLNKIESGFYDVGDNTRDALKDMGSTTSKEMKKMLEDTQKEMENFKRSMEKLTMNYNQSMRDLVASHKDKVKDLKNQLKDENLNFSENMKEKLDDFNKSMAEIEERHADKVKTIQEQQKDEAERVLDEQKKVEDKYKETLVNMKKSMDDRLADLKTQLDKEIGKGKLSDQVKIDMLKKYLKTESDSLSAQYRDKESQMEDEKKKVQEGHQERLNELQANLDSEKAAVEKAKNEKVESYQDETAKLKSEHDKRVKNINDQLKTEADLQKKYASEFKKFKDAVVEDDITRLKRQFAQERKELEDEHQQKLKDIARRVSEEKSTASSGKVKTDSGAKKSIDQNVSSSKTPSVSSGKTGDFSGFSFAAEGALVDRPTAMIAGEDGPEAIIPLSKPKRAAEIMTQAGLAGNQISINMPVTVVSSDVDIDILMERVGFQFRKQGLI